MSGWENGEFLRVASYIIARLAKKHRGTGGGVPLNCYECYAFAVVFLISFYRGANRGYPKKNCVLIKNE